MARHSHSFYLVTVTDRYSRYVFSWELSTNPEADFCMWSLDKALAYGKSEHPQ
jgi:hypothetical protein